MAAAGAIMVLAWVPGIDIEAFNPLGFKIKDAELPVWGLLFGVLLYYTVRFTVDCITEMTNWYGYYNDGIVNVKIKGNKALENLIARRLDTRAKWWDIGLPLAMAAGGIIAGGIKIFLLFIKG